ncbi:Histidine kinase [Chitinophaga sp. CF118]|nr:Histidine kinase [Chitinophaga sp. CF118]
MGKMFYIYSSLFISFALNLPKLLALRHDGVMSQYVRFDVSELIFQTGINFLFCLCIFYINRKYFRAPVNLWRLKQEGLALLFNLILLLLFTFITVKIQRRLFTTIGLLPGKGIGIKFLISTLLIAIELKIVDILRHARSKEMENARLRNAHLKAELGLLKGQLQPHFFFNALSSLSGVVREDPTQAQYYINQLSKVYRYSLQKNDNNLVSLKEELNAVQSYVALLKMRHEKGFQMDVAVKEEELHFLLPHMSLQPLIENASKHNIITVSRPLQIRIGVKDGWLLIENNLQPVTFPEPGTGIGLANLNERYKILMQKEIIIIKEDGKFIVKLPLK